MNPGAHCANGNTKMVRNFAVSQARNVAQYNGSAKFVGESGQCRLKVVWELLHCQRFVGAGRPRDYTIRIIGKLDLRPATASPGLVEKNVGHNASQPSVERTGGITLEPALYAHQSFLENVLGVGVVPGKSESDRIHEPAVVAGDFVPGWDVVVRWRASWAGARQREGSVFAGIFVGAFGKAVLEFLLGLAQRASKFRKLGAAEDQQDDDEDYEQFGCSEVHTASLPRLCYRKYEPNTHEPNDSAPYLSSDGHRLRRRGSTSEGSLAANTAAFPFAHATPNAELLAILQRVFEAILAHYATTAHFFGFAG